MSFWKLLIPLSRKKRNDLEIIKEFLEKDDFKKVKKLLRLGNIGMTYNSLKISAKLMEDETFPVINLGMEDKDTEKEIYLWNSIIEQKVREQTYEKFSLVAEKKIREFIAPHILGMDDVKEATMLQLFAKEKIHLLLLGDPGTGKTDILRAINEVAPISSYGLGSGTSSAGLTATVKGKEVIEGLLPMADNGICCVDELNLLRPRDRGSLLNAMEKGFITYDKANKHIKLDARISLLATANPKGDKFVGKTIKTWLKQIPFDPALISRFNIIFFIRRPGEKEFVDIAKKIVNERNKNLELNDSLFIRDYVEFSQIIEVDFDDKLKTQIVDFAAKLKRDEDKFLVEVSPRIILGIMRMAKASARLELRRNVEKKDLDRVLKIIEKSLYVK